MLPATSAQETCARGCQITGALRVLQAHGIADDSVDSDRGCRSASGPGPGPGFRTGRSHDRRRRLHRRLHRHDQLVGTLRHGQHLEPVQSEKRFGQPDTVVRRQGSPVLVAVRQPRRWRDPWPAWWMVGYVTVPSSTRRTVIAPIPESRGGRSGTRFTGCRSCSVSGSFLCHFGAVTQETRLGLDAADFVGGTVARHRASILRRRRRGRRTAGDGHSATTT